MPWFLSHGINGTSRGQPWSAGIHKLPLPGTAELEMENPWEKPWENYGTTAGFSSFPDPSSFTRGKAKIDLFITEMCQKIHPKRAAVLTWVGTTRGGMLVAKPRRPEQLSGERYSEKMKQTSHPTIKNCSSTLCLNAPISPYLNIINEILSCVMAKISKSSCLNHLKSSSFDRLSRLKGEFPSFSG